MSRLFPFLSARPHSAYVISLTPSVALTLSADAQPRRPAPLSALACPSHQGTTDHVQVTRPRRLYTILSLPLCLSSLSFRYNLCISPLALSRSYIGSPFAPVSSQ